MKIQKLFARTFWLGLICTAAVAGMIFRLSPSLAYSTHSTTMPPAQQEVAKTTIIATKNSGKSLYQRLGGYNALAAVIDDTLQNVINDPLIGKYFIVVKVLRTVNLMLLLMV